MGGYSYLWNDEQTEAELVRAEGLDRVYEVRDLRNRGRRAQADLALPEPGRVHGVPQPGRQLRAGAETAADEQGPRLRPESRTTSCGRWSTWAFSACLSRIILKNFDPMRPRSWGNSETS